MSSRRSLLAAAQQAHGVADDPADESVPSGRRGERDRSRGGEKEEKDVGRRQAKVDRGRAASTRVQRRLARAVARRFSRGYLPKNFDAPARGRDAAHGESAVVERFLRRFHRRRRPHGDARVERVVHSHDATRVRISDVLQPFVRIARRIVLSRQSPSRFLLPHGCLLEIARVTGVLGGEFHQALCATGAVGAAGGRDGVRRIHS